MCKQTESLPLFYFFRQVMVTFVSFGSFFSSRLLSTSTHLRFYPQRSSGQAVVTGVVSSPRYVSYNFFAHGVQHFHCSLIFIECCKLTLSSFPLVKFSRNKKFLRVCAQVRIELANLIWVGTMITYQVTEVCIDKYGKTMECRAVVERARGREDWLRCIWGHHGAQASESSR